MCANGCLFPLETQKRRCSCHADGIDCHENACKCAEHCGNKHGKYVYNEAEIEAEVAKHVKKRGRKRRSKAA